MNDGYGRTPITLARDAPIPQTPYRGALPPALILRAIDDSLLGGLHVHAIQETRIHQMTGPGISFGQDGSIFLPLHSNHAFNGQHIFACKIQIALVVGGDAHDCPSARSEEHTSELQSLMRISYAVFCLKKKKLTHEHTYHHTIR